MLRLAYRRASMMSMACIAATVCSSLSILPDLSPLLVGGLHASISLRAWILPPISASVTSIASLGVGLFSPAGIT